MDGSFAPRAPRVPFARPVCITTGSDHAPLRLSAADLSRGGLFVACARPPATGTRVCVALHAAGRDLPFAEAEVAWRRERGNSGFGLRFTRLRPRAAELVELLVACGGTSRWATPSASARRITRRTHALLRAMLPVAALAAAFSMVRLRSSGPAPASHAVGRTPDPTAPLCVAKPPAPTTTAYEIAIPTGAVRALRLSVSNGEMAVEPSLRRGTKVARVFNLPQPPRVVIDVVGREPRYSWQLEGNAAVKSVRVGARHHGTRVVLDLHEGEIALLRGQRDST
jgi:hypothetical protein